MNRSWRNTSNNSSTGFVYFNTNKSIHSPSSRNSLDTPEFLSFGSDTSPGSSPHGNNFSPSSYSSPRNHYYKMGPRQRGGKNHFYSPIKQSGGKFWRKTIGLTGPAENNMMNTPKNNHNFGENHHSQHRHRQTHRQKNSFHQNTPDQSYNTSAFYDPTCLKNPWAALEQKLAEDRKKQNDSLVEPNSSQSVSQSVDIEAEEASSDESTSEDDSEEMEESVS